MHDIAEFLKGRDPFRELDEEQLERLAARTEVEFFPATTTIVPQGDGRRDVSGSSGEARSSCSTTGE
jgi:signal-transduction protein with cAMP-binding, CBS, and nucleotidyltransferase domain